MRLKYGKDVGWKCERCGREWNQGWMLEFHHRIPTSNGGRDIFSNMECLCVECHYKAHVELVKRGQGDPRSPSIVAARLKHSGGRRRGK